MQTHRTSLQSPVDVPCPDTPPRRRPRPVAPAPPTLPMSSSMTLQGKGESDVHPIHRLIEA